MNAPELLLLIPDEVLFHGLAVVGFSEKRQRNVGRKKNLSRFRAHFSSDPTVYAVLLYRLQTTQLDDEHTVRPMIRKVGKEKFRDYFFMTINMLACYPTEKEAEANYSFEPCDRTFSTWALLVQTLLVETSSSTPSDILNIINK